MASTSTNMPSKRQSRHRDQRAARGRAVGPHPPRGVGPDRQAGSGMLQHQQSQSHPIGHRGACGRKRRAHVGQRLFELLRKVGGLAHGRAPGCHCTGAADPARRPHTHGGRLAAPVIALARRPGRAHSHADRAARPAGRLHWLRLPVAQGLPVAKRTGHAGPAGAGAAFLSRCDLLRACLRNCAGTCSEG